MAPRSEFGDPGDREVLEHELATPRAQLLHLADGPAPDGRSLYEVAAQRVRGAEFVRADEEPDTVPDGADDQAQFAAQLAERAVGYRAPAARPAGTTRNRDYVKA